MLNDQRKTGKRKTARTFYKVGQCVLPLPKPQTIIQKRVIDTAGLLAESDEKQPVTFQHSILCQTSLPYRDPGPDVRRWKRRQGDAVLEVEAGRALHPEKGDFVDLALPFGPKPRLVLAHLNTEALRSNTPEIEIEDSLTAFVKTAETRSQGPQYADDQGSTGPSVGGDGAVRHGAGWRRDHGQFANRHGL
jgi:hypothetical protein